MRSLKLIRRSLGSATKKLGYRLRHISHGVLLTPLSLWGHDAIGDAQRLLNGSPINTIFDIGANRGQTAVDLRAAFPGAVIHAFEPDPVTHRQLQETTKSLPNIQTYCFGFGASDIRATFHIADASEGNSFLELSDSRSSQLRQGWASSSRSITAELRRLDGFCHDSGIRMIDFLKIDVQGYEAAVIQGGGEFFSKDNIRLVLLEAILQPLYAGQAPFHALCKALSDRGFTLVDLYNKVRSPDGRLQWCDVLFF